MVGAHHRKGGVRLDRVSELLCDLIAIPSVNPGLPGDGAGESALAAWVDGVCQRLGLEPIDGGGLPGRPNSVWRLRGALSQPKATVMLEAHLDTVTLDNMPQGTHPKIRAGRIYGRGAADCKGPLAAMLMALEQLRQGPGLPIDVLFAAVVDEELGQGGARALMNRGIRVDAAIVAEPTSLAPVVAHNGVLRFQVLTQGRTAHSSQPHLGSNAIVAMASVISALEGYARAEFAEVHHPLCGHPVQTIAMIQGGRQYNVVPDACRLYVDRRTLPQEDPVQILAQMESWLRTLPLEGLDATVELGPVDLAMPGLDTPRNHPLVEAACFVADQMGGRGMPSGAGYGTDASTYWHVGGIPCVVLGPGDIAEAHTDSEWIAQDELRHAIPLYTQLVQTLAEFAMEGRWAGAPG